MTEALTCCGEIIAIYVYDIAADFQRTPLRTLLGYSVESREVASSRHSPQRLSYFRTNQVSLPPLELSSNLGPVLVDWHITIMPLGILVLTARYAVETDELDGLLKFQALRHGPCGLDQHAHTTMTTAFKELASYVINPAEAPTIVEPYVLYALDGVPATELTSEQFADQYRDKIAALLMHEPQSERISQQEILETTKHYITCNTDDIIILDWRSALMVDLPSDRLDDIHVITVALVQWTRIQTYDRQLDTGIDRAQRELSIHTLASDRKVLNELRRLRLDLSRLSDEVTNTGKFLGDWHLARLHGACAARFHLQAWQSSIELKLATLDQLYRLAVSDRQNRQMLLLEFLIVLLFVVDLTLIIVTGHG